MKELAALETVERYLQGLMSGSEDYLEPKDYIGKSQDCKICVWISSGAWHKNLRPIFACLKFQPVQQKTPLRIFTNNNRQPQLQTSQSGHKWYEVWEKNVIFDSCLMRIILNRMRMSAASGRSFIYTVAKCGFPIAGSSVHPTMCPVFIWQRW